MKKLCIIGFFVVSVLGVIFHFIYDYFPMFIFPKNESIFEHTKLIIIPMLVYLFVIIFCVNNKKKIFVSFISSILIGVLITIILYYTYYGILGFGVDWVNIVIYFISVFSMFYYIYKNKTLFGFTNSVVIVIILLVFLFIFTYYPLNIAFFN